MYRLTLLLILASGTPFLCCHAIECSEADRNLLAQTLSQQSGQCSDLTNQLSQLTLQRDSLKTNALPVSIQARRLRAQRCDRSGSRCSKRNQARYKSLTKALRAFERLYSVTNKRLSIIQSQQQQLCEETENVRQAVAQYDILCPRPNPNPPPVDIFRPGVRWFVNKQPERVVADVIPVNWLMAKWSYSNPGALSGVALEYEFFTNGRYRAVGTSICRSDQYVTCIIFEYNIIETGTYTFDGRTIVMSGIQEGEGKYSNRTQKSGPTQVNRTLRIEVVQIERDPFPFEKKPPFEDKFVLQLTGPHPLTYNAEPDWLFHLEVE